MVDQRTSATQLPSTEAQREIIKAEATRELPPGKENTHYPDFTLVKEWLTVLGIDDDVFDTDLTSDQILSRGEEIKAKVVGRMTETDGVSFMKPANRIYDYLSCGDETKPVDIIFVFGSKSKARPIKAAELYKAGLGRQLLMTGSKPFYEESQVAEAKTFEEIAVKNGVPADKILTEKESISIPDNVKSGLNLLDRLGIQYQSITAVTAWFAMRRSWSHLMKYSPEGTEIYTAVAPVDPDSSYAKDRWFLNEIGIRTVFNEFVKMKNAIAFNSA